MKADYTSKNSEGAFNLMELCVVMGGIGLLVMLVLPAMATNKMQSASAGCLYNLRHLMTAWEMYRTENNDSLVPNLPLGISSSKGWISGSGSENWASANANTNPIYYTSSLLWPYLNNNLSVYRCPGDVVPSANGTRIRSYSMNGQVAATVSSQYNPGWLIYFKGSDIIRPNPANLFVFLDESPASINDGYFQIGASNPVFPDIPACYLEGGCGFSFADGHGEIHRWLTASLRVPVSFGFTESGLQPAEGFNNVDWQWLTQHATSH
jgi:competence protein ComGC